MTKEPELDLGTPGASGRREHMRRRANREGKTRERHPLLGSLVFPFQKEPQHEKAWATGASGEEELAAYLARRCPDAYVLHDRRVPGKKTNIDHIAVTSSGVYVIDAKRYRGRIEVRRPSRGEQQLWIGARRKDGLVEALSRQLAAIEGALAIVELNVPVQACFCFLSRNSTFGGKGLPLCGTALVNEFSLLSPRRLARRMNRPGPINPDRTRVITEVLVELLPPA